MLFADKLGMPKKIKDLAESLDLEVTNHHDPEFDAKLCALIFGELTDKYPSYQELIRKIDEFALMFFFMWYASCENSNAWVCSYTVKGILVERNNTF